MRRINVACLVALLSLAWSADAWSFAAYVRNRTGKPVQVKVYTLATQGYSWDEEFQVFSVAGGNHQGNSKNIPKPYRLVIDGGSMSTTKSNSAYQVLPNSHPALNKGHAEYGNKENQEVREMLKTFRLERKSSDTSFYKKDL